MATIIRNCPHCEAAKSTFNAFGNIKDPTKVSKHIYTCAFECSNCHGGYIAIVQLDAGDAPVSYRGNLDDSKFYRVLEEYPKYDDINPPKYVPNNISNFYIQSVHNLKTKNYDASAMMSRKVLEVASKILQPKATGNLYQRIEALYSSNKITVDLKDWAHIIREDGNIAAHEEDPVSAEFADELAAFTELFLMYTFTMPGMVKDKKGKSDSKA